MDGDDQASEALEQDEQRRGVLVGGEEAGLGGGRGKPNTSPKPNPYPTLTLRLILTLTLALSLTWLDERRG